MKIRVTSTPTLHHERMNGMERNIRTARKLRSTLIHIERITFAPQDKQKDDSVYIQAGFLNGTAVDTLRIYDHRPSVRQSLTNTQAFAEALSRGGKIVVREDLSTNLKIPHLSIFDLDPMDIVRPTLFSVTYYDLTEYQNFKIEVDKSSWHWLAKDSWDNPQKIALAALTTEEERIVITSKKATVTIASEVRVKNR